MKAWEERMSRRYYLSGCMGVKPDTFEKMRGILQKAYKALHNRVGDRLN
jgi:hypothetical protein